MKTILLIMACSGALLTAHSAPSIYLTTGDTVFQYHGRSGALLGTVGVFPGVSVGSHQDDLTLGPDGALYSVGNNGIWRIDVATGTASEFVHFGPEVTDAPGGFAFGGDGFFYLTSGDALLRYDAETGEFVGLVGTFPGASVGSYSNDLSLGPDGALYSIGNTGIWRIDVGTGTANEFAHFGPEVTVAPGAFVFGNDGSLYLTSHDALLRYDGETGAFIEIIGFFPGATTGSYSDDLAVGKNGALYAHGLGGIWRINIHSGTALEVIHFGPEVPVSPGGFALALP